MAGWSWLVSLATKLTQGYKNNEVAKVPRGPSIATVDRADTAECRPFFGSWGGMTVKVTSGGIDNGAFPICDSCGKVAENDRLGTD